MVGATAATRRKLSTVMPAQGKQAHNRRMTGTDDHANEGALGRFLTVADVAEVLNISAAQAYGLVRTGELPAIKVGAAGHWRVERSVLESYIEAKYEENRRLGLWNQAEFADIVELSFGLR